MEKYLIEPGDILQGTCGGAFRDSYDEKAVIAVGRDWILARSITFGSVHLATGEDIHEHVHAHKEEDW